MDLGNKITESPGVLRFRINYYDAMWNITMKLPKKNRDTVGAHLLQLNNDVEDYVDVGAEVQD